MTLLDIPIHRIEVPIHSRCPYDSFSTTFGYLNFSLIYMSSSEEQDVSNSEVSEEESESGSGEEVSEEESESGEDVSGKKRKKRRNRR